MAGGDKPLEDFILITVLAKGDATKYICGPHSQFAFSILAQSCFTSS